MKKIKMIVAVILMHVVAKLMGKNFADVIREEEMQNRVGISNPYYKIDAEEVVAVKGIAEVDINMKEMTKNYIAIELGEKLVSAGLIDIEKMVSRNPEKIYQFGFTARLIKPKRKA